MGDHELFFHFVVCNLSKLKVEEKEVTEKHMVSAFLSLTWSWGPILKCLQWMATKPGFVGTTGTPLPFTKRCSVRKCGKASFLGCPHLREAPCRHLHPCAGCSL